MHQLLVAVTAAVWLFSPTALGRSSYCASDSDCPVDSVCETLRSNRCECRADLVLWLDECLPVRPLNASCRTSGQCRRHHPQSVCDASLSLCQCRSGYMQRDGQCHFLYEADDAPALDEDEEDGAEGLRLLLPAMVQHRQPDTEGNRKSMLLGGSVLLALITVTCVVYAVAVAVARHQKMVNDKALTSFPSLPVLDRRSCDDAAKDRAEAYQNPPPEAFPTGYAQ